MSKYCLYFCFLNYLPRNHDDDPVLTKKSALLCGQLLKHSRQMEQFHTDVDVQLMRILNRFQRTSVHNVVGSEWWEQEW